MGATPRALGYRMPAEWEPQGRVWLSWPTNRKTWPGDLLERVRDTYVDFIAALAPAQSIGLLVDDAGAEAAVRARLAGAGVDPAAVTPFRIPTVDAWIRDYGPTFLVRDAPAPTAGGARLAMAKWTFDAWGGKYADLRADDGVPAALNEHLRLPWFEAGVVLEGGSIEVNGRGAVLVTEQCLLHPNRNPHLDRAAIEAVLGDVLGVSTVVWLGEGIAGDDTDGHVDDLARFVGPGTVLACVEGDPADANAAVLRDNWERLAAARDQDGRPLRLVPLPMPDPVVGPAGRLPASYANFYVGNGAVAVPVFGQAQDRAAIGAIRACFPGRRVVGIDCAAMVHGLGTLHCASQQEPAV